MFASRVRLVNIQARLQPAMQTIPAFGQVAVLALGGWLALNGRISLGTFLAFSTYMLLITPPIRQLAAILTVGQLARAGAERIFDLLDSTPLVQDAPDALAARGAARRGALRARDVRLHVDRAGAARLRPHRSRPARRSRSSAARARASRRSALMLPRFYDVHAGRDRDRRRRRARRPTRLAAPQHRRRVRGLVPLLRHDHRQHRVRHARRDAARRSRPRHARPRRTSSSCGCPHGYDTVVGEQGLTLSGGQRQRVALARALLSDPQILLLDDATSSVDSRIEEEIHATLRRIASTRTTILIAHRRSSLSLADRIVVVDKGRVLDAGTHEELVGAVRAVPHAALGTGRRRRGLTTPPRPRSTTTSRSTASRPSAWRGLDDEEIRERADRRARRAPRARPPRCAWRAAAAGRQHGRRRRVGRRARADTGAARAGRRARPGDRRPAHRRRGREPRSRPTSSSCASSGGTAAGCSSACVLVALDAVCTLAGPMLVRYGIDSGVAVTPRTRARCGPRRSCSS